MRIFVAGARGAIGRPLIAELLRHGHQVTGISRSAAGAERLQALGVAAAVTDALHPAALESALRAARPDAVIDELTTLPADPADYPAYFRGDRRLRLEGGGHLHRLARDLGVARYLQQSSGFFYGPGTWYWPDGAAARHLRNGLMPVVGAGSGVWSFVHIEDAAQATVAALTAEPGTYNIVDDDPSPASVWLPAFARWLQAAPPPDPTPSTTTSACAAPPTPRPARSSASTRAR